MDNIYPFSKNSRPVWTPSLQELEAEIEELVEIPLLGSITAGSPIERIVEQEKIRVPANMVRKNTYALQVKGESMIDDNIVDGDIIIINKTETAENGQSVVALIHGDQVTLKKFYIEESGIRLQPANPEMSPMYFKHNEVHVLGIVSGVIRKFD
ncbi:MAG: transcriptional repressor LexA [Gammaproteobacteria bacterium]|nr:transcriptional repressor LexA [Gammaproteobacteria bacterium]